MNMITISSFDPRLERSLPATYAILKSSNLTIHPVVSRIVLHGSRGLAVGYRPYSDIDLSLIIDGEPWLEKSEIAAYLQNVLETTRAQWQGEIETDLAVIFDVRNCGLKCFDRTTFDAQCCPQDGLDCFGLYKRQKRFNGIVIGAGVQVKRMYPCLKIWQKV
jgi:hypothetical protein